MEIRVSPAKGTGSSRGNQRNPTVTALAMVFVLVILGFGTVNLLGDINKLKRAHGTFLPVDAKVISSEVEKHVYHGRRVLSVSYVPHIEYAYTVNGRSYRSLRYYYTAIGTRSFAEAKAIVSQYPPGATVRAWYDPASPADSVLDNGPPREGLMLLIMAPFWAFGIALASLATISAIRKNRAAA
jgi:Protein of unknown function (DUF3592)